VSGSGKKSLAEKLAANCGVSSAIMPGLPLPPRTMQCFNFDAGLISLSAFHITKVHLVNARTERCVSNTIGVITTYDDTDKEFR